MTTPHTKPVVKKIIIAGIATAVLLIAFTTDREISSVTAADFQVEDSVDAATRKKLFFDFLRPIVVSENAKILELRKKLVIAKESKHQKKFVAKVARDYNLDWVDGEEDWDKLFKRVDAIALELVLAQSANETAWGQSRFAQQGNNFFGHWCYQEGCGIVPEKRAGDATHEVERYDSVNESVRRYIKNINTSEAYKPLRDIRKDNRAAGKPADAIAQAGGLNKYSERGTDYVEDIRNLIRANEDLMLDND